MRDIPAGFTAAPLAGPVTVIPGCVAFCSAVRLRLIEVHLLEADSPVA